MADQKTLKMLYAKYDNAIQGLYKQNDFDISVLWAMLVYELDAHFGRYGREHKYEGVPADFDWDELEKDYQEYIAKKDE